MQLLYELYTHHTAVGWYTCYNHCSKTPIQSAREMVVMEMLVVVEEMRKVCVLELRRPTACKHQPQLWHS